MKNKAAITGLIAVTLVALSAASVSAQADVRANTSTSAEVRVGGLGTGLNHMVRTILGDDSSASLLPAAEPAAQTMMMSVEDAADTVAIPSGRAMKAESSDMMFSLQASAQTEEDVRILIRSLLQNDANLQSIDASDTHVRLTYRTHGTVLKFLRVTIPVTGEAYISGKTTVSYPWYAGMAGVKSDIRARFEERIAPQIGSEDMSADTQIQLIGEMHQFFTEEFAS